VGVFLTLAALAGSVGFWVRSSDVRPVLVAARDLPPGATLQAADLTVAYVHMDDALIGAAVSADDVNSLAGRQLKEPVHAQQILVRAQLAARDGLAADQVAMTIPARNDSAVDGGLQPGDFVQILLTVSDKNRGEAHTVVALERAHVLGVGRDQSTSISSSSSLADENRFARGALSSVTLAVTPEQARHLAEARRSGDLDILLLPPTEPAQP
jgi:Flp pilus assembly protein CpaB